MTFVLSSWKNWNTAMSFVFRIMPDRKYSPSFYEKNAYIRDKQINIITSCYLTQYWLFSYCLTFCILDALASELLLIHERVLFQGEQISRHSKPHLRPPPSSILSICKCGLWTGTFEASWFIGNASLLGPLRIKGENELPWAYL